MVTDISGVSPIPGALIVGKANHLPADKCGPDAPGVGDLGAAYGQGKVPGVLCLPEVTALRLTMDEVQPTFTTGRNLTVELIGSGGGGGGEPELVPYKTEGLTEMAGWMTTLVNNHSYIVGWQNMNEFGNLSYSGHLDNFRVSKFKLVDVISCRLDSNN